MAPGPGELEGEVAEKDIMQETTGEGATVAEAPAHQSIISAAHLCDNLVVSRFPVSLHKLTRSRTFSQ